MTRTKLPERNLDVLRAIAVFCVVANHTANNVIGHNTLVAGWIGQAGVQAFFVHTSLVLMASMEKDGAPSRKGWIERFYIRRFWRIYPLAIAVIGVVLLLRVPDGAAYAPARSFSAAAIAANIALLQGFFNQPFILGVLWTLPLELQMYVLLPLCFLVARRRSFKGIALLFVIGCAMAIAYTSGKDVIPGIWRLRFFEFVPCFLAGVLAYWLLRRGKTPALPSYAWIALIFADLVLGLAAWNLWVESWAVRAGFCVILGVTIPLAAEMAESHFTRAAHTIATYSYGIYLLHPIALWFGLHVLRDQPPIVQGVAATGSLVLGCLVAYHGIEKSGIKLGRALAHQRGPLVVEPAAP
ncbi:MAG: acyltransferase [Gemmatimonadaceae bacterium]|nr:acyltransferase [Gemmatimonadaceae bacterium]